jgi:3-hydroxy-9,10-secoandrosta-1,3,5(10)-triene-9,17-dione monooxygenase
MSELQQATDSDALRADADEIAGQLARLHAGGHAGTDLPDDLMAAMIGRGLLQVLQPRCFGGLEATPEAFFDVQRRLARVSMSAGWLVGVLGLQAWQLALFEPRAQEDVWNAMPRAVIASSFMPVGRVEQTVNGWLLSGSWRYASGCRFSDWAMLGAWLDDGAGGREHCALLVPRADYDIRCDWQAVGLRSTGSHSIVVRQARVPRHRIFRASEGFRGACPGHALHANPLYRIPFGQLFGLTIALPAVGTLEGALDACVARAAREPATVASHAKLALALAASTVADCRETAARNLAVLVDAARAATVPDLPRRAALRLDAAQILGKCVTAVGELFRTQGLSAVDAHQPLARAWTDINTASLHTANSVARFGGVLGAVLAGLDAHDPLL